MTEGRLYYAQTMPGVEKIAWLEIRKRLPRARFVEELFAKEKNGIVVFEYAGPSADLLQLRTTEDVYALVASDTGLSRDWLDLRTVARMIEESRGLNEAAGMALGGRSARGGLTYRIIARKEGQHQYRRLDLEQAAAKGVERRGGGWRLVEDDAELEIWVNVLGSRLLCGARLSDRAMRHRDYRLVNFPAALRPSVAAAMVFLTELDAGDVFLDPMCGSGTILAERLLAGDYRQLIGGDVLRDRAEATARSLHEIGGRYTALHWDARRLPLASASVDKVAVNPPFGKQIGSPEYVGKLYPPFFAELERVLRPGGRATVLSSEYELVRDVVRARPGLRMIHGYAVAVLGQWGRIYILARA